MDERQEMPPAMTCPATRRRCRRLLALIEAGAYREGADALDGAFAWDAVGPGRAFWEAAHRKLRRLAGAAPRQDPQGARAWGPAPVKSFLETLRRKG